MLHSFFNIVEGKAHWSQLHGWMHNLKMNLQYDKKDYVLDTPILDIKMESDTLEENHATSKHVNDATKVAYIMIPTIDTDFQKSMKSIRHMK